MKTILLPTDYSENANNAIHYAINLFGSDTNVKYILHHSYMVPTAGNTNLYVIIDTLRKEALKSIKKVKEKLLIQFPGLLIEVRVEHTMISEGISSAIEEEKVDTIVMGTKGATGLKEIFLGSNTVDVIDSVDIPVIVVPKGYTKKVSENLVLFRF